MPVQDLNSSSLLNWSIVKPWLPPFSSVNEQESLVKGLAPLYEICVETEFKSSLSIMKTSVVDGVELKLA